MKGTERLIGRRRLELGVGTVVWKKDGQENALFLFGMRNTYPVGCWSLVGGSVESDSVKIAAAREMFEEAGIVIIPNDLRVISIDDKDICHTGFLNFGCEIQLPKSYELDLSLATHRFEFQEWDWFSLADPNSLTFVDQDGRMINKTNIFTPCLPTLQCFIEGKLQIRG